MPTSRLAMRGVRTADPARCGCTAGTSGSWPTRQSAAGRSGRCLQQVAPVEPIPSRQSQVHETKCLDANAGSTADGTAVIIYDCTGGANPAMNVNADGSVISIGSGECFDANGQGAIKGTSLVIWTCNGASTRNGPWRHRRLLQDQ
jgi:hypothetical protein